MRLRFLILTLSMLLSMNLYSQIITWCITPEYDEIKPYSEEVYYCNKGAKWGLISIEGKVLLSPKYDFITPMVEGYAIAGIKDGKKNKISCIIDKSFNHIEVNNDYYLVNRYYSYFSEGKIPVSNKSGKQGFLDTSGELVIKCQFDNVHPFSNGFASVFKHPNAYYIRERYDTNPRVNTLPVDFNYGDITFASSFYNDMAVVAYNDKAAVINTKGTKIGNYKGKIDSRCYNKFDYTIIDCGSKERNVDYDIKYNKAIVTFQNNDLYGYKIDDKVIVYETFEQALLFTSNGYAIASVNGKYGLLQLLDGSISSYVADKNKSTKYDGPLKATTKGTINQYDYIIAKAPNMQSSDFKVLLNSGDGSPIERPVINDGNLLRVPFEPFSSGTKQKELNVSSNVYYKGLLLYKYGQTFNIDYPVSPPPSVPSVSSVPVSSGSIVVSGPQVQTEKANEKDVQVVYAVISNHTGHDINITATLSIPTKDKSKKQSIRLTASDKRIITLPIENVLRKESVNAILTLSTGKTYTNRVVLKPYY